MNNILVGYIDYFDSEKNFGFADVRGQRIFFHMSNCREVDGTPEEPVLTTRPSDRRPGWYRGRRRMEHVILQVTDGPKGPKATTWGYVPERTMLEDLLHYNTLQGLVGADLTLSFGRNPEGRSDRHIEGRLTADPLLTPGDPWELRLEYDWFEEHTMRGLYGGKQGHSSVTYQLGEVFRYQRRYRYSRCVLAIYLPDKQEFVRVKISPPS